MCACLSRLCVIVSYRVMSQDMEKHVQIPWIINLFAHFCRHAMRTISCASHNTTPSFAKKICIKYIRGPLSTPSEIHHYFTIPKPIHKLLSYILCSDATLFRSTERVLRFPRDLVLCQVVFVDEVFRAHNFLATLMLLCVMYVLISLGDDMLAPFCENKETRVSS